MAIDVPSHFFLKTKNNMVRDTDSYFSLRMGWDFPDQEFDKALAIKEGFPTRCDFWEPHPSSATRSKRRPCCIVSLEKPVKKKFRPYDSFKRNTDLEGLNDVFPPDEKETINFFKERAERRDAWTQSIVKEIKSLPVCPLARIRHTSTTPIGCKVCRP